MNFSSVLEKRLSMLGIESEADSLTLASIVISLSKMFQDTEDQKEWLHTFHPFLKLVPADLAKSDAQVLDRYLIDARSRGA